MYDELVKRLREADEKSMCGECGLNLHTGASKKGVLFAEAADAIEELSREAEEYKAAYRKEHDKRIAENKYLYDELVKAVRAELLMTPMRIEAPEPPKEET